MANRIVFGLKLFAGGAMLGAFGSVLPAQSSVQRTASYLPAGSGVAIVTRSDVAQGTVTGRVTDVKTGQPLEAVTITVQGTELGATTTRDGTYRLANVPSGSHTITARQLGFTPVSKTVTVTEGGTVTADFALNQSVTNLQQVVVTGTAGNQTREAQSAVVATVPVAELTKKAPLTNVSEVLEGRIPSVVVSQGSGITGSASRINIRGQASVSLSNEPLVFVDGIRMSSGTRNLAGVSSPSGVGGQVVSALNDINPDDIESIEVVKGPAAATLYGADASAGVIQIITKQGRLGSRPLRQSFTAEYNKIEPNFTPYSIYGACPNSPAFIGPNSPFVLCRGQAAGTIVSDNANVRNDAFRDGNLQSLKYSAQGGGDRYGFYLSGAADNEQGTTRNNILLRRSGRASANLVASPKLSFDANFALARNDYKLPQGDQSSYGYLIMAALTTPIVLTDDANGNLAPGYAANLSVPAISDILVEENTLRTTPSLQMNYAPFSWMTNRLTVGADLSNTEGTTFFPKNDQGWYTGPQAGGYVSAIRQNLDVYTADYQGNINTSLFGNENFVSNLSFGSQYISTTDERLSASGQGLITNSSNLVSSTPTPVGAQNYNQQKSLGYYAQEQIGYKDKLFVQAATRIDNNSAFGNEAKSYVLPKFGASYVISKEGFWQPLSGVISTMRLRTVYGTTGRSPTPGASLTTYVSNPYITDAGVVVNGVAPRNPGNQDLKPERGKEFEAGFDAGFFNDRAGLELTYFNKKTEDLLLRQPLPPSLGFSQNPYVNIGSVLNRGFEFNVRATPISKENFSWDANFNGSTLHNELTSLGALQPIVTTSVNVDQKMVVGRSLAAFYTKKIQSIDPTTGIATVSDTSEFVGNQQPTFQGSFNTTITLFKNLRIYAMFQGQTGGHIFNLGQEYRDQFLGNSAEVVLPPGQGGYSAQEYLLRIGPFQTVSGQTIGGPNDPGEVGQRYIQSSNFVRFQELSATLTLPDHFAQALHAAGASLTVGGRNLHLWSNFEGWDPEVNATIVDSFFNAELFTQPPTRRWIARLNLQF